MKFRRVRAAVLSASLFFILLLNNCQSKQTSEAAISVERVNDILNDSSSIQQYLLLDVRERMDYVRGHLVSSVWIHRDSLESKLNSIPREKPLIVYDDDGYKSLKVAILLLKKGFENLYVMEGGFAAWTKKGFPAAIQLVRNTNDTLHLKKKSINLEDVYNIIVDADDSYVIIDIRSRIAFHEAHIKNAISIPYLPINEFVVNLEEKNFSRDKPLIIYSDQYNHDLDDKAIDVLLRNDYTQVYHLYEGFEAWANKYPKAVE